ncbi:WD40 repeat domain-containing protein [Streptomyces sp. NBC_00063]|uniref:WD40 repeat domain-containing protein n=1 Tax=Streptomyces sp. NBC_00063 TaxID=2975638 RepID=UPI00224F8DCF|nr:WD40 repeat domain-containing protein [Streptomyces sp. NBC_00063]MCX5440906.1 WD40 repeat domain-containing protein [Streptomyces sp. NBC_00063]
MTEQIWGRPAAGREPAGVALLAWLADPAAPRLCLVTGNKDCGKSALLAWLVAHGSRPGTRPQRRVHGFAPLADQTVTTAAWTLSEQLSVAARTPGELVRALSADMRRTVLVLPDLHAAKDPEPLSDLVLHLARHDHIRLVVEVRTGCHEASSLMTLGPAVMDLDDGQWTDSARKAAWSDVAPGSSTVECDDAPPGEWAGDLNDVAAVCTSDPWQISRRYEQSEEAHGGLRPAWLRAGASLTRDQAAADRALTLLAALGDEADPRLPEQLSSLASGAAWRLVWRRVRGDIRPPWPGPARALAAGHTALEGSLLVADHRGTVRVIDARDGASQGRLPSLIDGVCSVSACPDGTVLVLDGHGRLHTQRTPSGPKPTGIRALLDDGPSPMERLVEVANNLLQDHPATAAASSESLLAMADGHGSVRAYALEGNQEWHRTVQLHTGGVTALAVLELPTADGSERVPLIYSGGIDGHVRVWQPGADPLDTPVAVRECPVTALDAVHATESGPVLAIAWADGLVEYVILDTGQVHAFRPGPPVQAVALHHDGLLVVGTDETLVCLQPM